MGIIGTCTNAGIIGAKLQKEAGRIKCACAVHYYRAEIRFHASSYSAYCDSDGYALTLHALSEQPVHDAMVVTTVNAP